MSCAGCQQIKNGLTGVGDSTDIKTRTLAVREEALPPVEAVGVLLVL